MDEIVLLLQVVIIYSVILEKFEKSVNSKRATECQGIKEESEKKSRKVVSHGKPGS